MKTKRKQPLWKIHDGGMILDDSTDPPTCCGYLFNFDGRGVFSPDGKVEVTVDQADRHNVALNNAQLKGLDNNCQIGQGGMFYFSHRKQNGTEKHQIRTWLGAVVSDDVYLHNSTIVFTRKGKVFRGRLRKSAHCFNFKRIR